MRQYLQIYRKIHKSGSEDKISWNKIYWNGRCEFKEQVELKEELERYRLYDGYTF